MTTPFSNPTQPAPPLGSLSLIVPTRRVDDDLVARVRATARRIGAGEILFVEPSDTPPPATASSLEPGMRVLKAERGRGTQCNRGGYEATGDWLMFLHDDTELPSDAPALLARAMTDPGLEMACFRIRFDREHWILRLYAFASRFESLLTTFGDQAMVVRRSAFHAVGGFPDWPLFEDVELARRLRRRGGARKLPGSVTTSARRYSANGLLRQQLSNALLLARFLLGASPHRLARVYERQAGATPAEQTS
jgi:rSAM/selenodomain-associated transferase 2